MSAILLVGCNLNDDQNPPPQDNDVVNPDNGANIKNVNPNPNNDNNILDNNRNNNRILDKDRNNNGCL